MIFGYPWLRETNPVPDWRLRTWAYQEATTVESLSAK